MSTSVATLGDLCSGHGCFPPRAGQSASSNVFVNHRAVHCQGDPFLTHQCRGCTPHAGVIIGGSNSVFVNGKRIARHGDAIDCGSTLAADSSNVFAGE